MTAPAIRFPPPLVFLSFAFLGPLIDRALQLPPPNPLYGIGVVVTLVGLALVLAAQQLFRRRGENPVPWTTTNAIVESGLYGFTRNPMYLGMAIAMVGVATLLRSWSAMVLVPVAIAVIDHWVIAREEAFLASKFGAAYDAYRERVPRWL